MVNKTERLRATRLPLHDLTFYGVQMLRQHSSLPKRPSEFNSRVPHVSDTREGIHFHLYMGGIYNIFSGTRYEDASRSITDFLNISHGILQKDLYPAPVMTEMAMMNTAETMVNQAIYVDAGEVRVMWAVCDGVCYTGCYN